MRHVANPPAKPLMLFDGDCHFCRRWIERWKEQTRGRVEYASSQEAGGKFPEIAASEFQRAVFLIETNGEVFRAGEAVCRSLGYSANGKWLEWSYDRLPGFAPLTEAAYAIVAKNRTAASAVTRFLWGDDVRRPTYFAARALFLRAVGLVYLIAFLSLWWQVDGLIGSGGVSPGREFLLAAKEQLGSRAPLILPTLCWLNSSDAFLHFLCGAGAAFSLLLIFGTLPGLSLGALYLLYLSLTVAGQTFFSFQWDILLLEAGFLALFFAPWGWKIRGPVPRAGLFLLKLLLFKLMFMSGVVKLYSGDDSWWNLTALNYHYETQPLPTVLGWWAAQAPEWFTKISTAFVLLVELVAPFLIWMPRRLRLIGFGFLLALQGLIALTGNYAFFNLLTVALCLLLLDDQALPWSRRNGSVEGEKRSVIFSAQSWAGMMMAILVLPVCACQVSSAFKPDASWPRAVAWLDGAMAPFRISNGYGLFRVMTKTRPEIVIEGSADGVDWQPYVFKWKPGDPASAPRWVAPHQPRLDWQMWFAALGSPRGNSWLFGLMKRLLENNSSVIGLMGRNPFPEKPPRYVRAILYRYNFTTWEGRRATGNWWKRQELREYLRTLSLADFAAQ